MDNKQVSTLIQILIVSSVLLILAFVVIFNHDIPEFLIATLSSIVMFYFGYRTENTNGKSDQQTKP
jgi:thiamine transporter ThiT